MTSRVRLVLSAAAVVAGDLIAARFGAAAPAATPSTYIIDARGRIAWAWFGATSYSQLDLAVTLAASS
jgi:hypothetical protein